MLFRFISGVSLAGTYMPGLQILNDRLEEQQRLKAVPWYTGAFGLGTGGSFFLTGQLVEIVDWPVIFSAAGILQVSCVFIVLAVVPSRRKSSSGEDGGRHPLDFRPVFTNLKAMAYIFGYTGHSYELFAFRAWIVTFLVLAAAVSGAAASRVEIANYVTIFSLVGFPASVIGAHFALRGNRRRLVSVIMIVSFVLGGMWAFHSSFWCSSRVLTPPSSWRILDHLQPERLKVRETMNVERPSRFTRCWVSRVDF